MILSSCTNAGIVSIFYPLALYGYAQLEERRPQQSFWRFMLRYSLIVLILKFIMNLNFISDYINDGNGEQNVGAYRTLNAYFKFGLHHIQETIPMFWYMFPEVMIITYILLHQIVERFTGLSEVDVEESAKIKGHKQSRNETVYEAIDRIKYEVDKSFKKQNTQNVSEESKTYSRSEVPTSTGLNETFDEKGNSKSQVSNTAQTAKHEGDNDGAQDENLNKSEIVDVPTQLLGQSEVQSEQEKSEGFWDSDYLKRIFPRELQQKPGTEYYGLLMGTQFMLIVYLVYGYSNFAAMGPYEEQNLFKAEMVIVLFIQIAIMIAERYCARTVTLTNERAKNEISEKLHFDERDLFEPPQDEYDFTVRHVAQKLKFLHLHDYGNKEALSNLKKETIKNLKEKKDAVEVTAQQKTKFFLHWIHLIVVHIYIFWYLPITSNLSLYGEPDCKAEQRYGCKEFRQNFSLQVFYLGYCVYFAISAL